MTRLSARYCQTLLDQRAIYVYASTGVVSLQQCTRQIERPDRGVLQQSLRLRWCASGAGGRGLPCAVQERHGQVQRGDCWRPRAQCWQGLARGHHGEQPALSFCQVPPREVCFRGDYRLSLPSLLE